MHIDWWSRICNLTWHFQDGGCDVIHTEKCCHLLNECTASFRHLCSSSWCIVHSFIFVPLINSYISLPEEAELLSSVLSGRYVRVSLESCCEEWLNAALAWAYKYVLKDDCDQWLFVLQNLQTSIRRSQNRVDALQQDFSTLKQLVVRTRPGISRLHVDVQQLENNLDLLIARWENLVIQVSDR